jgi:DNA-directed RNA polymerase sigma subunit (sigma70/sigma32)
MIKVGTYLEAAKFFYDFEKVLHTSLGRTPSDEEIAQGLSMRPRMCEAIKLRFGRDGIAKMKLEDVAERMNITSERVRQLLGIGLRHARYELVANGYNRQDTL